MKRFLAVLLVYSLVFAGVALVLNSSRDADRQAYIDGHLRILESRIEATVKNMGIFSRFVFETSINTPEVTGLLSAAWSGDAAGVATNREALRQMILPIYDQLLHYDYRQLAFHFPDSVSFLRMHSPENHGDNLYTFRQTVRLANEKLEPISGFEEGRIFNGYRFVYPLLHAGVHCGSVELSFSMDAFITILSGTENSDIIFAIKRSVVEDTVFQEQLGNYMLSPFSDDYLLDTHLQNPPGNPAMLEQLRPQITDGLAEGEDFGIVLSSVDTDRLLLFKAIRNLNQETVGYLIMATDDTGYALLRTSYRLTLAIAFLAMVVATILTQLLLLERSRLKALASTDQLTKLANRHRFIEVATGELLHAKRHGLPVSMVIFDVDFFKSFNDSYGHNEGDRALKGVAEAAAASLRKTDTLGRWGGEEFIAILPFCDLASARRVADKLRLAVCDSNISTKRKVTVSVGVAGFDGSENLDTLIARADSAMYKAKDQGRNCVACKEPEE